MFEGADRKSVVVTMIVGADGAVKSAEIYRARVTNKAQLTYSAVGAWLDSGAPAPEKVSKIPQLEAQLRLQARIAAALRKTRLDNGALEIETVEARAVSQNGKVTAIEKTQKNTATDLIEDFMIGANSSVAKFLEGHNVSSIRRIVRSPERWERIVELAKQFGETLPREPSAPALNAFLDKRRQADPTRFADLSLSVIKLLGRGEYMLDLPGQKIDGHFGLAVSDYTHSTAPNRRFPDLLTQRLLKSALIGQAPEYSPDELRSLAAHCTAQEDNAAKVERQVAKSAAALLLTPRVGQRFDAIVTGASDKGTWVPIPAPTAEGKLIKGFEGLDVGDQVHVKLVRTDVARGFIDFERLT